METGTDKRKRKNVLVSKADLQALSIARSCPRDNLQQISASRLLHALYWNRDTFLYRRE